MKNVVNWSENFSNRVTWNIDHTITDRKRKIIHNLVMRVLWQNLSIYFSIFVNDMTGLTTWNLGLEVPTVCRIHYNDVIMSAMASRITSLTIVYSIVYSGADQKNSKFHVTGLCVGNSPITGEFPAQRASNAENVAITYPFRSDNTSLANLLQIIWHAWEYF